ncbi:MAG: hypothetical protein U9N46_00675 [Euryarchaeota archaeon]|nr:hypothetical protein [Euryarchaeota archaeon]
MSKNILAIGIILIVAPSVSACLEIATDPEDAAHIATTTIDADNRIENTPVAATPEWELHPVEVDAVPVYNLSAPALSNTSADDGNLGRSPDGSKIAVVTMTLRESGSDRDIHIINLPTTGGLKNKD